MRILIAEDNAVSRKLLQATLEQWGNDVVLCSNGHEAWEALQEEDAPRFAILDWMMPGMDGTEVCRRVRKFKREAYSYIILLTAKTQREDIIAGLESGADDYITKPFDRQELKVRLRAGRRILELQQALIIARDQMKDRATRDPLTGLWNRTEIFGLLETEIERSKREQKDVAVVMMDLDEFKQVNDTYGHLAGDAVLRIVSERMCSSVREYDSVGRYGGEEFLIVAPGCDSLQVADLAERLRKSLASESMDTAEGMLDVTASFGVASIRATADEDAESIVAKADSALLRAKEVGRNCVEVAGVTRVS